MKNRLIASILLVIIILFSLNNISYANENIKFKDIEKDNWYYYYINELVERKIIDIDLEDEFNPNEYISFAEFLKISLIASTGKDYPLIQDVHWGMTYYQKALELNIIKEDEIKYNSPEELNDIFNSNISREDMAEIIFRIDKEIFKSDYKNSNNSNIKKPFKDISQISENRIKSIKYLYEKGIIDGKEDRYFPKNEAKKIEAASIIIKLLEK